MERCDVLVIGAGAAGSVAALKLARAGLSTVLVDQSPKKGGGQDSKIDITQDSGLKKIILELRLPVAWASKTSRWHSRNRAFELKSRVNDLFIKRGTTPDSFDVSVIKAAEKAGCAFLAGTRALHSPVKGMLRSVELERKGKRFRVTPDYIVCAGGPHSSLAASCLPQISRVPQTIFSGFGLLVDGLDAELGSTEIFLDSELAPGGYFYLARNRLGHGVAAIVVEPTLARSSAYACFKRFVHTNPIARHAFHHASSPKCFIGASTAGPIERHHHYNVLFAGDSARLLDPLLGYGVNHAIYSGYEAANAIISQRMEGWRRVGKAYEAALARDILPEIQDGQRARKAFNAFDNNDLDAIVETISEVSHHVNLDDFLDNPTAYPLPIVNTLVRKPGVLRVLRHLHRVIGF